MGVQGMREALAAALETFDGKHYPRMASASDFNTVLEAARERLAQLPEKCGTCHGVGRVPTIDQYDDRCLACHGGKVYPAELVERIARTLLGRWGEADPEFVKNVYRTDAVAVLAALDSQSSGEET